MLKYPISNARISPKAIIPWLGSKNVVITCSSDWISWRGGLHGCVAFWDSGSRTKFLHTEELHPTVWRWGLCLLISEWFTYEWRRLFLEVGKTLCFHCNICSWVLRQGHTESLQLGRFGCAIKAHLRQFVSISGCYFGNFFFEWARSRLWAR